jgi:hypothetical protein
MMASATGSPREPSEWLQKTSAFMAEQFHYPADLLELLIETIPRLVRSKKSVILFFEGAGVEHDDLAGVTATLRNSPDSITKFEIVRTVLARLNTRGDSGLGPRRGVIRRVVEFEDFESCWDNDRLKAKGLVASVREAVNKKDAFTRMQQEREAERDQAQASHREAQKKAERKRCAIEDVKNRLFALFGMDKQPQERGRLLEGVLNDLFRAYDIHVRENFIRRTPDSVIVLEQIDGVIELAGTIHLVEMKWLQNPVGVADFGPHLVRVMNRANVSGIFISNSRFTQAAVTECADFLNLRTNFLCTLEEIVSLLQRQGDLVGFLKAKSHAAIVEKKPYLEILN